MASPKRREDEVDKTEVADSDTLKVRLEEAKASSPVLVVISGKPLGKSFFVTKPSMILGRDLTADMTFSETAISRRHTEFQLDANTGTIIVQDLGSTNGTYVNDQRITGPRELEDGDLVRCGNTILKYLQEGQIENLHYGKMYDLATRDDMTGSLNKKALLEMIAEDFERAKQQNNALTLIFFDIDHFKQTNDTYGHLAGDFVLKETCSVIMNKMIRQQDALGRYGGEEFVLILRRTPLKIAVEVAERIRATVEKHEYTFDNQRIPVTISLGVVALDSTSKNAQELLALADKALYEAKSQGRNRVCVR